jgi:hypothetical protein
MTFAQYVGGLRRSYGKHLGVRKNMEKWEFLMGFLGGYRKKIGCNDARIRNV